MAYAGRFGFLIPALLFRIESRSPNRRRLTLGGQNRTPKVSRKRWTKLGNTLTRQPHVVLRQRRNAIGNIVMLSGVELIRRLISGTIVLQRPQYSAANDYQRDRNSSCENLAR